MYIKSVIIDGFKSYGRRTEIDGFDSEFNAITGLNGTGKSNILDSICFVLGISNLSQVNWEEHENILTAKINSLHIFRFERKIYKILFTKVAKPVLLKQQLP